MVRGRPLAKVGPAPVRGSTRPPRPSAGTGTYSAPPGPMALPAPLPKPATSRVGVSAPAGGFAATTEAVLRIRTPLRTRPRTRRFLSIRDTSLHLHSAATCQSARRGRVTPLFPIAEDAGQCAPPCPRASAGGIATALLCRHLPSVAGIALSAYG